MKEEVHIFESLRVWNDENSRSGSMNMAVDETLMSEGGDAPIVRFYSWSRPSISIGYFNRLSEARELFVSQGSVDFVRRWSGGGVVDHREDFTYTIFIPKSHPVAGLRGAEIYRMIHRAVAQSLNHQGVRCRVVESIDNAGGAACFVNPVAYDVLGDSGVKLAGAAQKRTRAGLLHQGSVLGVVDRNLFTESFLNRLTVAATEWVPSLEKMEKAALFEEKYRSKNWIEKF